MRNESSTRLKGVEGCYCHSSALRLRADSGNVSLALTFSCLAVNNDVIVLFQRVCFLLRGKLKAVPGNKARTALQNFPQKILAEKLCKNGVKIPCGQVYEIKPFDVHFFEGVLNRESDKYAADC